LSGFGNLPACVVRIRSMLRFIAPLLPLYSTAEDAVRGESWQSSAADHET
jgi:hypothetical protein